MTSNDNTTNVEANNGVNKITKLHSTHLKFTLQYITLTIYYIIKDTFRWWWQVMTAPKMWKQKTIESAQNGKIALDTLKVYNTLYITYFLLYCKWHIQIISNDNTIIVVTKNNRVNKRKKLHSILLEFTL